MGSGARAQVDVLIVGAGPTGLMAAALLARFGIRMRILDKSVGPAKESRAMVVQARSLELFLGMGLSEAFLDRGFVVSGAQLVVDGSAALTLDFDDIGRADTPFAFPLMIPQADTEAILLDDLERLDVSVEYGVTVTGLVQHEAGVTVQAARNGAIHDIDAGYLIGADGAHSVVRKALGLSFEGAAYPQNFLLADCTVDWPFDHGKLSIFLRGRSFAAFFPMRGSNRGRIIAVDPGAGDTRAGIESQGATDVALDTVQTVVRDVTRSDATLSDPTWTARYHVHHRGVDRYGEGRVFVAGDAAHIHSPAGGQGMNTGLQDASNLAWKLAAVIKGGAPATLLASYNAERWPIGRKLLVRTDRMFSGMTSDSRLLAGIRNLALPVLGRAPVRSKMLRAGAFNFISELGIRYHEGAFVTDDVTTHAPTGRQPYPRAGSRAPDGRISRTRTIFDLLRPDNFAVLALSWLPLGENEIASLHAALRGLPGTVAGLSCPVTLIARSLVGRDPRLLQAESNDVFAAYGLGAAMPQGLFLVRPDGYLAYRSDRLDAARLQAFADRFQAEAPTA